LFDLYYKLVKRSFIALAVVDPQDRSPKPRRCRTRTGRSLRTRCGTSTSSWPISGFRRGGTVSGNGS